MTGANVLNTLTTDAAGSVNNLTVRTLTKSDIGLSNIDNTSDINKPISTATSLIINTLVTSSSIGIPFGIASLDFNGKVPLTQLSDSILGQVVYMGGWNASTNVPTIPSALLSKGNYYVTTASGSYLTVDYQIGDWIISDGSTWSRVDNTDAVSMVAGRTGNIVLTKSDVGLSNVDNTSDINKPVSTATTTAINTAVKGTTITSINTQIGTSYTLVLSDSNKLITLSNASPITVTVPLFSAVPYDIGTKIDFIQLDVGKVTFAPSGAVIINSTSGYKSISGQYIAVSLIKIATDTWILLGNLIA